MIVVGALSAASILLGTAAPIAQHLSAFGLSGVAYAQAPSSQVNQYARAAFAIEQQRQQDYAEAKKLMSGNVPDDVCHQQSIPSAVRDICGRFLKRSSDIIRDNGLTIAQFNDITRRKETDPALQQQIQAELLRLQKTTP